MRRRSGRAGPRALASLAPGVRSRRRLPHVRETRPAASTGSRGESRHRLPETTGGEFDGHSRRILIVGLGIATIAGILLSVDAVFGAGARFKAEVARIQLETLRTSRALWQADLRAQEGSQAEIDKDLEEEEAKWGPQERKRQEHADSVFDRHENIVVQSGALGVILLVLAFALQLIGTVMIALEP